jgi:hypothetical protein
VPDAGFLQNSPLRNSARLVGMGGIGCRRGRASRQTGLTGREHNSPKSAPYLPITSQWEQTTARHNVVVFNAAACSDWTRLHK